LTLNRKNLKIMGLLIVPFVFFFAIATGALGVALGFGCTGDRSLGVRVCLTVAAGIGGAALGAALGFVAGYCFLVATWSP
jgi:hypothetical protein